MKPEIKIRLKENTYKISGPRLGKGFIAEVYPARWLNRGRDVALKIMHAEVPTATGKAAFNREIIALKGLKISAPWVIKIHDAGEWDGFPVIIEELMDLKDGLDRASDVLSVQDSYFLFTQLFAALSVAHGQNIIYNDFKREHFFWIPEGSSHKLKIIDWNGAQIGCSDQQLVGDVSEGVMDCLLYRWKLINLLPDDFTDFVSGFRGSHAIEILSMLSKFGQQHRFPRSWRVPGYWSIWLRKFWKQVQLRQPQLGS